MALYLIPTPISEGALDTLTPRVLDIVRRLDVFIVERAKTARHFIRQVGPLQPIGALMFVELDREGNLTSEGRALFEQAVRQGRDVGLLSEAGCPGVADPGAAVVALAHHLQVPVVPLVGPSAILLALMASGLNGQAFAFHGYLSAKRPELVRQLRQLEQWAYQRHQTQMFMETPYRTPWTFEVLLKTLQVQTSVCLAQDLTGAQAFVRTLPVGSWRETHVSIRAIPTIFLLGTDTAHSWGSFGKTQKK